MLVENAPALRSWLQTCLGKFSDADPIALAKYVVALVKKDKDEKEMYSYLIDQLDIFLHKGTKEFVDMLFEQLRAKDYLKYTELTHVENVSSTTSQKIKSLLTPEERLLQRKMMEQRIAESKKKEEFLRQSKLRNADIEKSAKIDSEKEKKYKRCKDYDEKGYCFEGDMCVFDHGSDPLVVEDMSALNFHVKANEGDSIVSSTLISDETTNDKSRLPFCSLSHIPDPPGCQILPPPPPPLPPVSPPPLPPLPKTEYIPEAYNPEEPGMDPFYSSYNSPIYSKQPRNRELVGVTIEKEIPVETNATVKSENIIKRKLPVYSRLGPSPKKRHFTENTYGKKNTLLLRKVPSELNNIMSINEHFSKFGKVTNIEVCYENSPDSALVKFQHPFEASLAYKSTEAVMNNRFIKVFYYSKPNVVDKDSEHFHESENIKNEENVETTKTAAKDRVLPTSFPNNNRNCITRTVFNSSSFVLNKKESIRSHKDEKKDALCKRLALNKKMGDFLKAEIEHSKSILSELNKTKNPQKKVFLKTTLKTLESTISKLQEDFKKSNDELHKFLNQNRLSKNETEKQLLDAEIDLYKEQSCTGENTAALMLKVKELKDRARALGLIPKFPDDTAFVSLSSPVAQSTPIVESKLLKDESLSEEQGSEATALLFRVKELKAKAKALGLIQQISPILPMEITNVPSTPNRTLFVSGIKDKEFVNNYFQEFDEVEKIEHFGSGFLVSFASRHAAEMALSKGNTPGPTSLAISWFEPQKTADTELQMYDDKEEMPILMDDDDDEEEEDDTDRSWRH